MNKDTSNSLTIKEFQDYIYQRFYESDNKRGTSKTFMWFVEEVGELATALQKSNGEGGNTSGNDNPEEEFADVFAWLCTLANINGIDLTKAVWEKHLKDGGQKGVK